MKRFWSRYRTSSDIAYDNANAALGEALPELKDAVTRLYAYATVEPPGPHWLYDEVLNPYLRRLLDGQVENEQTLKRIFDFIEHLSASGDKQVREIVTDTILAALEGEPRLVLARRYMGPATRRLLKKAQQ
jgi:hypothetical protein